jgi:hypothetical protein
MSYLQWNELQNANARTDNLIQLGINNLRFANKAASDSRTDSNRALKAVEDQAEAMTNSIGPAATDAAKAARISAVNSGRAVSSADKNLQISLKPFLSPAGILCSSNVTAKQPVILSAKPTTIYVFLKNTGQSPASVRDFACGFLSAEPLPFEIECPRREYFGEHAYETGGQHYMSIDIPAFSPDDLEAVKTNKKRLYVVFGASYKDQFGNSYHIDYCMMNSTADDGSWPDCPESHYAHEAKQTQKRNK